MPKRIPKKRVSRLRDHIESLHVYEITCSVGATCSGEPERAQNANSVVQAEREFLEDGWILDYELEDELHLACPSCIEYLREETK